MDLPPPLPAPLPAAPRKRPLWPWALAAFFVGLAAFGAFVIYRVAVGPVGQAFTDGFQRGFNPSRGGNGRREADAPSRKDADARRPVVVVPGSGRRADDRRARPGLEPAQPGGRLRPGRPPELALGPGRA